MLCWLEGSQSGNDDNVVLHVARHHLPTDLLVFWHWQIQPSVCILNLPRKENTHRAQARAHTLLNDALCGSNSKLQKVSTPVSTGHRTDPTPHNTELHRHHLSQREILHIGFEYYSPNKCCFTLQGRGEDAVISHCILLWNKALVTIQAKPYPPPLCLWASPGKAETREPEKE